MKVPFGKPLFSEAEFRAVRDVLKKPRLTTGGRVKGFEEDFALFCDGGTAVAVSSCGAALHLLMLDLKLEDDDEVIVPALTHVATAHAVEMTCATPVFVDVGSDGNIQPELVRAAITSKTKAIICVHYLGKLCDMAALNLIGAEHNIPVIEDCALALGTKRVYRNDHLHSGMFGYAGCFSFYPVKHITTGEGGMVLTKDPALAKRLRSRRSFGLVDKNCVYLGQNYRMTEMQAAIGREQLIKLPGFLKRRQVNHAFYANALRQYDVCDSFGGSYYGFTVFVPPEIDRDHVRSHIDMAGYETSIYYHYPVPLHDYYREKYGYRHGEFPMAEKFAWHSICLPTAPHINEGHVQAIITAFKGMVQ